MKTTHTVSAEDLQAAHDQPVLKTELLPDPITIESMQLLRKDGAYMVRARSTDGAEGLSFCNAKAKHLYPILNQLVIPYFIGKDARDLEDHLWEVYRHSSNYKLLGQALWNPVAWVEMAILDLIGRVVDKSIADLLGGAVRTECPFYVASGRRDSTPEEEIDHLQMLVDETHAPAIKFRVGGRMSRNADAMPGRTPKLIELSRKHFGDEMDIHADSNSSYNPPQAIEIGRMLEDINAVYFEEPCPFDHLEDTKIVTETLDLPVSGGEQEASDRRFRWMIQHGAVNIVQPDLHYYGGLIRSARVSRMAALADMPTTVHISGGMGFVYMLIFTSFTPDIGRYQEYKRGIEKVADLFSPALKIENAQMSVPQGPGTGITDFSTFVDGTEVVE
ncbi:TPA: mandelate racemase/muconate lactonizing enzyme family protein [Candidatus Latescibacteria bacterium]|nr:mandelate racemase/muconate lactonizing enzyme family protein [Candidatus Latescibacterota bacterium]